MFAARFLPGLRAPAMFTAGVFKIPAWKFLLYDGSAAAISVPLILALSYRFADELDQVRQWVVEGQAVSITICLAAIVGFVTFKLMARRRLGSAGSGI